MAVIKVLIVDDAEQARVLLRLMLAELAPDVEIVGEASNAFEAWEEIIKKQPEVVFLDIEMPGRSGIELARQLMSLEKIPHVVFTTAYDNYAIEAFRLSALDYLLKPINEDHLLEVMNKLRRLQKVSVDVQQINGLIKNLQQSDTKLITIPVFNGYENVELDRIIYIKADGSYSHVIQKADKTLTVSKNLKYFESLLENHENFIRVHRSCIISLKHVRKYDKSGRGTIIMVNDTEIDLARERRTEFLRRFGVA